MNKYELAVVVSAKIEDEERVATVDKCKGYIDFVWLGEDLGTQIAPMISLDLYRQQLRPIHKQFVDITQADGFAVKIILALAGDGVHQNGARNIGAAEQADGLDHPGTDPPGVAFLVDLEVGLGKHPGRMTEPQQAVEIAAKMVIGGVLHAVFQTDDLSGLVHHVHQHIGRQAFAHVVDPLEQVAVAQGGHANGGVLIVDLVIVFGHLELGDHVGQLAQLAAAQPFGRVLVQHGHLVKGNFRHIGGKIAVFDGQKLGVGLAAEHHAAQQGAHQQNGDEQKGTHANANSIDQDRSVHDRADLIGKNLKIRLCYSYNKPHNK